MRFVDGDSRALLMEEDAVSSREEIDREGKGKIEADKRQGKSEISISNMISFSGSPRILLAMPELSRRFSEGHSNQVRLSHALSVINLFASPSPPLYLHIIPFIIITFHMPLLVSSMGTDSLIYIYHQ